MNDLKKLLTMLDHEIGLPNTATSNVKAMQQGFDNRTQEHVVWLECRCRVRITPVPNPNPQLVKAASCVGRSQSVSGVKFQPAPSELPQPTGSSRLTAMRMFELRFLGNYGEASFRIARLDPVGCGKPKASEGGALFFRPSSFGQAKERDQLPGCPRPKVA